MVQQLFEGESIKTIIPVWPNTGIAIDLKKAEKFGLKISPEILKQANNNIKK